MKKFIAVLTIAALSTTAVAGPVARKGLTEQEIASLSQSQQKSQKVLQVQAGHWADDYGGVVVVGIIAAGALAVGIVALADD
jgi:hypothetical protein